MQLTAKDHGYIYVYIGRNPVSRHSKLHKAFEKVDELEDKYPDSVIWYQQNTKVVAGGKEIPADPLPFSALTDFTLYDCTRLFPDSPMEPVGMAYKNQLWTDEAREYPEPENIDREAAEMEALNSDIGVIDIEHWPRTLSDYDEATVAQTCDRLCNVLDSFRERLPGMRLGYYSMVPRETYTTNFEQYSETFYSNTSALKELGDRVDFLAPCFYTRWIEEDKDAWAEFAVWHIERCRELWPGKPVIPFISPIWYNSVYGAENGSLFREYISGDYWKLMIGTLEEHAEGGIMYLPWDVDSEIARGQEWFQATLESV